MEVSENFLSSLPLKILFHIVIKYLSYPQILNLCLSSKDLYFKLCSNPFFWQSFYHQTISTIPLPNIEYYHSKYKQIFLDLQSKDLNDQLIYAARNGYIFLIQDLISKSVDITAQNNKAIIEAAFNGQFQRHRRGH